MKKVLAVIAAALVVLAAQPALAAASIEGYVWGNEPANPSYLVATGYEYNSAGGAIKIVRSAVGTYAVIFQGMAGAGGVAHASAYGVGSNYVCSVESYGPVGTDEVINVLCFDTAGVAVDTRFVANVTNRKPVTGRFGYFWSSNPVPPAAGYTPPAAWSYDSTGSPIAVGRTAVGRYRVFLGAFAADSAGIWNSGYLRVTPHGSVPSACQVLEPALQAMPHILEVRCYDTTGFGVDTRFTLTYGRKLGMLGAVGPHASATVDLSGMAPVVAGWTNTYGGAPTASEIGIGLYEIVIPGAAAVANGHVVASIMGTPPMFCNVGAWFNTATDKVVWVRCWDGNVGVPTPAMMLNLSLLP